MIIKRKLLQTYEFGRIFRWNVGALSGKPLWNFSIQSRSIRGL